MQQPASDFSIEGILGDHERRIRSLERGQTESGTLAALMRWAGPLVVAIAVAYISKG